MKKIDYAFIVHSRDRRDLPIKYPILNFIPNFILDFITMHLPPISVSHITGLVDADGRTKTGLIIGIPMTARQLLEHRDRALNRIVSSVKIAKKMGAVHVGLGAMTASLSKGGLDIVDNIDDIYVTTGRMNTIRNITEYLELFVGKFKLDRSKIKIAIVGAAGGIGSGVAISLARKQYRNFMLIDLERKLPSLVRRIKVIEEHSKELNIQMSHKISEVSSCSVIIAATSSPEIVIRSDDVESGTIIINDAQPSDISPDIVKNRSDVLVVEGGVVHTPDINCHFNLGLAHKTDIFSCLAETLFLSYLNDRQHRLSDSFDVVFFDRLQQISSKLGYSICTQNNLGIINENELQKFAKIIVNRNKSELTQWM